MLCLVVLAIVIAIVVAAVAIIRNRAENVVVARTAWMRNEHLLGVIANAAVLLGDSKQTAERSYKVLESRIHGTQRILLAMQLDSQVYGCAFVALCRMCAGMEKFTNRYAQALLDAVGMPMPKAGPVLQVGTAYHGIDEYRLRMAIQHLDSQIFTNGKYVVELVDLLLQKIGFSTLEQAAVALDYGKYEHGLVLVELGGLVNRMVNNIIAGKTTLQLGLLNGVLRVISEEMIAGAMHYTISDGVHSAIYKRGVGTTTSWVAALPSQYMPAELTVNQVREAHHMRGYACK